ncbi:hypothetical protein GCM10011507_24140 [Edaphobacter acidisoli]|uniref:DUF4126 domain-containing protein n=1 Tax=Edaphobacter acidisoli TaxID=2040573 RepID=A0A916W6B4_9BACT|nr:DUF4126 family protein [Edaphobacter acidisoli]GGA71704.1 hypothetical protein GCM10011507_24140 [Edaphobacter acidisoli]
MAMEVISWLIALPLLGTVTGLRTFTPLAVLSWFAYSGALQVQYGWDLWMAKLPVAIFFTVIAICELIADKQPWMLDRIILPSVLFKVVLGAFVGAVVADGLNGPELEGIILGVLSVLVGTYGGYLIRKELVVRLRYADCNVALVEDAVAVLCAIFALRVVTG